MCGFVKIAWLALLIPGVGTAAPTVAQDASIRLSPIRQIRKGVDAWPLILDPKGDRERKINGYLTDLNTRLARSLADCDASYAGIFGKDHNLPEGDEGAETWTQKVKLTMSGPELLSLVAATDTYCGGAHPYGFTSVAVFDLTTGEPADPTTWFLPNIKVSFAEEDDESSALEKSASVAGLVGTYGEATHHECDDIFSDGQPFLIWPDANSGKVAVQADRLPGCCEACGIEVDLTLEQARKLGFSETFLQSIRDAHHPK